MNQVVVVADRMDERGLEEIGRAPGFEVVSVVGHPERLEAEMARADALLVRSATRVTEALMEKAPRLRVIGRAGIGVDNIDVPAATRRGIAVLNAPGANTVSAAEHTFALLLSMVRHIPDALQSMRDGEWDRARFGGTELRGKTLGLVGLGRIGMHVTSVARAFGMTVIAHDPFLPEDKAKDLRVTLVSLEDLLRTADVVSLHAPLTDETRHLLNRERFALMKPTAVIVNAARGGLIDADALVEALENGQLAGAALDVFDPEPLPADSPLRRCDKITLTPHLAASTEEAQERVSGEICSSVVRALQTGDIGSAVNVAGVNADALRRARPAMELARHLGRLAGHLIGDRVTALEVSFAGEDEDMAKPTQLGALEGLLESMGIAPVSIVNAGGLAEERGIAVGRRVRRVGKAQELSIGVKVKSDARSTMVVGVLPRGSGGAGRVVRIDDFEVDIPAHGAVVVLRNRDVPGVIGRVGTMLGAASINIAFYHQSRAKTSEGVALAAIAVDQLPDSTLMERLEADPDVVEVRLAQLDRPVAA